MFPGSLPDQDVPTFFPSAATRLSFPLGYWNALAVFVALGVPLLLRIALLRRHSWVGAAGLASIPALAAVVYLASSRGGVLAAFTALVAFVALTDERSIAVVASAVAALGSALAIVMLHAHSALVNGPLDSDLARNEGASAAVLLVLTCTAVGVAFHLATRLPRFPMRLGRRTGRTLAAIAGLGIVLAIVVADPKERFESFKRIPDHTLLEDEVVREHLLSGGGSGRWQFWSAAVDQWREHPVVGQGGGTYESWWAEHGSFAYFVRDAHSLYLEALGELGIVGFVVVVGLVVAGVAVGVYRSLRLERELRVTTAALTAMVAAYAVAAGLDWLWEMTAVTVLAVVALALSSGPATVVFPPARAVRAGEGSSWTTRHRIAIAVAGALVAWIFVCAQAISLLSDRELARSRAAVADRDVARAAAAADAARRIQPWAATPYLQLALVREAAGDLAQARIWTDEAVKRSRRDWRLWLVSARIEAKLGDMQAAERNFRRALELNPRSPLFEGVLDDSRR